MTKQFDPTKPVQTRDGWPARILCMDRKSSKGLHIVALLTRANGQEEYVQVYREHGKFYGDFESCDDLVNIPEKRSLFSNVYREGSPRDMPYTGYSKFLSMESAQEYSKQFPIPKNIGVMEYITEDDELVDIIFHKKEKE